MTPRKTAPMILAAVIVSAVLCATGVHGFTGLGAPFSKRHSTILFAKKAKGGGKGFGKPVETTSASPNSSATATSTTEKQSKSSSPSPDFLQSIEGGSDAKPEIDDSVPIEQRTANILRKNYGLRTREEQEAERKREEVAKAQRQKVAEWKKLADQGEDFDIMAVLPAPVLVAIDRFLKVGVAICTVLFVSAGGAITVEAWSKASNSPLPENIDNFIVSIVEPNFTPGLLVLLGFSVSLGAFGALQLSSGASTYREK